MAYKLGGLAKLYIGTAGTGRATWPTGTNTIPSLTLVGRVGDLKLNIEMAKLDATTRDTPGWVANYPGLNDATIDFQLKYDPADATYQTLRTMVFGTARNTIPLAILDGDKATSGTEGLWCDAMVFKFDKGEPVKDLQVVDVTMAPALASSSNAVSPQWIVAGTGPVT